jgi:hypothetical protein
MTTKQLYLFNGLYLLVSRDWVSSPWERRRGGGVR